MRKTIKGVPVWLFLMFFVASGAFAYYLASLRSTGNVLGAHTSNLLFSSDGVTYNASMPVLFNESSAESSTEVTTGPMYFSHVGRDLDNNVLTISLEDFVYTQGEFEGAEFLNDLRYFWEVSTFTVNGVDKSGDLTDYDGDFITTLGDLAMASWTTAYEEGSEYILTFHLNDIDSYPDLAGDSLSFNVVFSAD